MNRIILHVFICYYVTIVGKGKSKSDNEMPGTLPKQSYKGNKALSGMAEGDDDEEQDS